MFVIDIMVGFSIGSYFTKMGICVFFALLCFALITSSNNETTRLLSSERKKTNCCQRERKYREFTLTKGNEKWESDEGRTLNKPSWYSDSANSWKLRETRRVSLKGANNNSVTRKKDACPLMLLYNINKHYLGTLYFPTNVMSSVYNLERPRL